MDSELIRFSVFTGSLVRPKVVRSVHYCPATKKTMERKYTDMTSLEAFPSSAIYPTKVQLRLVELCKDIETRIWLRITLRRDPLPEIEI